MEAAGILIAPWEDPELVLDQNHRYWWRGRKLFGVSWILENSGLIDPEEARWIKHPGATERGRILHRITELLDKGTLDVMSIDVNLWGWVDGYKRFLKEMQPKILLNEQRLVHPLLGYCGTLDRLVQFGDGILSLLDIKSGQAKPHHGPQMGGYSLAIKEKFNLNGLEIERHVLEINENGEYKLVAFNGPEPEQEFCAGLVMVRYLRRIGRLTEAV